eukprot:5119958-Prymnesium_polylepis.1
MSVRPTPPRWRLKPDCFLCTAARQPLATPRTNTPPTAMPMAGRCVVLMSVASAAAPRDHPPPKRRVRPGAATQG